MRLSRRRGQRRTKARENDAAVSGPTSSASPCRAAGSTSGWTPPALSDTLPGAAPMVCFVPMRYRPDNVAMVLMTAGPRIAMNSTGKMKKSNGKSTLTGSFIACSSAR